MTRRLKENHGSLGSSMMSGFSQPGRVQKSDTGSPAMATAKHPKQSPPIPTKARSVPSTPAPRPQSPPGERSTPSTNRPTREGSPRSIHSGSSQTPPAHRRPAGGCKYETGMAKARRRVPYSLGPEKLESNPEEASKELHGEEEKRLTADMRTLYQHLLPTPESESRRQSFVQKLERLLQDRWPGCSVRVSVFGSTGNKLGTGDSDVDIGITTDCKEMERVCSIAELLANNGMERVVCVSSARVPIVKVWDPVLEVACDINVNNPIALENTELIKSYVSIDDRVRPLAMIVKYWAKRRTLNDAALGGTLSSYTWICLVLNFLQSRNPPILPSLQNQPNLPANRLGDVNIAFDRDLEKYRGFGQPNSSSLGELLYQFYRYYGHQVDFEKNVMSVREGKVISKSSKGWDRLQDNRLCVEEPFNVNRNLANTADDTSMRGIHMELRRAFAFVADGRLDACCEEYVPALHEYPVKPSEKFIQPTTRTIIPQPPPQPQQSARPGRSSHRSGRNSNRNGGAGRRSSNPAGRTSTYLRDLPFAMTPQELQLQAQHQQHLLHDQLFQQYQYLQMQEQELRMQLYQQNLRHQGMVPTNGYGSGPRPQHEGLEGLEDGQDASLTARAMAAARVPMSAPLYQNRFTSVPSYIATPTSSTGVITNPGSPMLSNTLPDINRYARRASTNTHATGSLRAHSQPARSMQASSGLSYVRQGFDMPVAQHPLMMPRRPSMASSSHELSGGFLPQPLAMSNRLYDAGRRPVEYVGYYVGRSPSLAPSSRSTAISPIPSHAGLAIHNTGLSPRMSSRSSKLPSATSSPSMPQASLASSAVMSSGAAETFSSGQCSPTSKTGPLVVDGSVYSPNRRHTITRVTSDPVESLTTSVSTYEDSAFDTPSSSDELAQQAGLGAKVYAGSRTGLHKTQTRTGREAPARASNRVPPGSFDTGVAMQRDYSADSVTEVLSEQLARHSMADPAAGRGRPDAPSLFPLSASTPLTTRTNGVGPSSSSPLVVGNITPNGWQTQTKKRRNKRKSGRSDPAAADTTGGEAPPQDESLRKGG